MKQRLISLLAVLVFLVGSSGSLNAAKPVRSGLVANENCQGGVLCAK